MEEDFEPLFGPQTLMNPAGHHATETYRHHVSQAVDHRHIGQGEQKR
jgi:hypothetical protein